MHIAKREKPISKGSILCNPNPATFWDRNSVLCRATPSLLPSTLLCQLRSQVPSLTQLQPRSPARQLPLGCLLHAGPAASLWPVSWGLTASPHVFLCPQGSLVFVGLCSASSTPSFYIFHPLSVVLGGRVNQVPTTPFWPEVEIWHLLSFSWGFSQERK